MSERNHHFEVKKGSEKNFGLVFAAVFLVIGLWPLIGGGGLRIWALGVALVLAGVALVKPVLLATPNRIWFKFGMLLGAIVAPVVMALVYFTTVVPIGLIMRMLGKDLLRQRIDKSTSTYWIEREDPVGPMKNQY